MLFRSAAAPLVAFVLYFVMSRSVPFYKAIQKKLDGISRITRENLGGARVIRAFSRQQNEERRFEEASDDLARTSERVGKLSALLNPLTYSIINLAIVALLWFGGLRVNSGALSQGQIIAFVNYMTQILLALIVVANLVVIFTKASASAARVNEIFDTVPSVADEAPASIQPAPGAAKIVYRDVGFAYSKTGEEVLSHVTVDIAAGETVGIIGGTGAGKSTLVGLIPRFYDVTAGSLCVDGVDVREYPLAQLRGKIGVVPQHTVLFAGTLRENMQWGAPEATDKQIACALEIAQAKEFVDKLPLGLDTPIAQGGKNLSGGQRQRLTIARALVGKPDILILDDSASALDFATDAALRKALSRELIDTTVLMVSQRVNTVKSADRIIVLDDGAVAGIGTHTELFESCEVYREICLSQLSREEAAQ